MRKNNFALKRISFLFFFIFLNTFVHAQDSLPRTVFIEAGGSGGFASVNLDKGFISFRNGFLSGRIGAGYLQGEKYFGSAAGVFVLPTMVHCMIGKNRNWLETGFGLSFGLSTKGEIFSRITPTIGYRFQKTGESGIFFRLTYAPIISDVLKGEIIEWAGISLGYSFSSK
ncbi:MAG TPA: hypothetical protein VFJ43_15180 [Bacteroidia bacterium]|nr:hypothetical protein [Bacteroidia bacterium]